MPIPATPYIWMDGSFVDWDDANVHVLTHSLHYGGAVFEGIRAYQLTDGGTAIFRLREHMKRLHDSAKMLQMELEVSVDELCEATIELLRKNNLASAYIRPLAYYGYGEMGIYPGNSRASVAIAAWTWDSYLGQEALDNGIRCNVSSWRQRGVNQMPPAIKSSGNYLNSALAKLESIQHGFTEAIMLNEAGFVTEGTGENIFVVKDGVLCTPPASDGILTGITRDSIMKIAQAEGIPTREMSLVRTDLYTADEMFLTGSAAELTPVASVDNRSIACPGPITKKLQTLYLAAVKGSEPRFESWLTRI